MLLDDGDGGIVTISQVRYIYAKTNGSGSLTKTIQSRESIDSGIEDGEHSRDEDEFYDFVLPHMLFSNGTLKNISKEWNGIKLS